MGGRVDFEEGVGSGSSDDVCSSSSITCGGSSESDVGEGGG